MGCETGLESMTGLNGHKSGNVETVKHRCGSDNGVSIATGGGFFNSQRKKMQLVLAAWGDFAGTGCTG